MATTYTHVRPASFADRANLSLSALVSGVVQWNANRRTRAALARLSDHELDDIGLTRGDIELI